MSRERTPGIKLLFAVMIGAALIIPLIMVYALVSDRQAQSRTAQDAITAGWGGQQVVSGPVIMIPYTEQRVQTEVVDGRSVTRTITARDQLFLSPERQTVTTDLEPERRKKSIYETVTYLARLGGQARFALPDDLGKLGIKREQLQLEEAEIRFGASDPRGLQAEARVSANGKALALTPGNGVASSGGSGFSGFLEWDGTGALTADWAYSLRGSHAISLVPRGGETIWEVKSPWPHPSFGGSFLPDSKEISDQGFTAKWSFTNLALGQALVLKQDPGPPATSDAADPASAEYPVAENGVREGGSMAASIGLVEPVDLYSQVDRSVKYGFLFIGFTFLAYLMFDVVGGARVASAEYLLTGAGLVLFFVMLLAFAEVIGFSWAYALASAAIIGLLTAYSAAILGGWRRAGFIGALLTGLYALLYVLLSLEAWSLVIGALLLFAALAAVMFATRKVDWSGVGRTDGGEPDAA